MFSTGGISQLCQRPFQHVPQRPPSLSSLRVRFDPKVDWEAERERTERGFAHRKQEKERKKRRRAKKKRESARKMEEQQRLKGLLLFLADPVNRESILGVCKKNRKITYLVSSLLNELGYRPPDDDDKNKNRNNQGQGQDQQETARNNVEHQLSAMHNASLPNAQNISDNAETCLSLLEDNQFFQHVTDWQRNDSEVGSGNLEDEASSNESNGSVRAVAILAQAQNNNSVAVDGSEFIPLGSRNNGTRDKVVASSLNNHSSDADDERSDGDSSDHNSSSVGNRSEDTEEFFDDEGNDVEEDHNVRDGTGTGDNDSTGDAADIDTDANGGKSES